jgi:geranylgeranyl transferase type-2 subunit beta
MQDQLARALHRDYVVRVSSDTESFEFQVSEHLRLSGVYWGACALHLIDSMSALDTSYVVSFVRSCQRGCGGFAGNLGHDAHMLYTLSAVQILALFDALDTIDEDRVMRYVASLQRPDGSFAGDEWGEVDTRFSYCALCCASLLGRLNAINVASAVAFVQSCQNFDGGYGCEPGGESHAGQIFT